MIYTQAILQQRQLNYRQNTITLRVFEHTLTLSCFLTNQKQDIFCNTLISSQRTDLYLFSFYFSIMSLTIESHTFMKVPLAAVVLKNPLYHIPT